MIAHGIGEYWRLNSSTLVFSAAAATAAAVEARRASMRALILRLLGYFWEMVSERRCGEMSEGEGIIIHHTVRPLIGFSKKYKNERLL